jgi:hypothetical protein
MQAANFQQSNQETDTMQTCYSTKFKNYTREMCDHAIADCHATLAAGKEFHSPNYIAKLWQEIDALRDRQLRINSKGK